MSTRFVIVLSLLAIAAIVSTLAYRAHSRQADLQARALAEAQFQNDALTALEGEARQMLATAVAAATAASGTPDQLDGCGPAFQEVARSNPMFAGLTAFDLQGLPICTGPATWLKRVEPRLLERALASEGFVIGEHTVAETISKRVLPFAQPFYDRDHRALGVVVTMVELDRLARRLARNWRMEDSIITVADRSANILVRLPNSGSWVGRRLPDELVSVLRQPGPGTTKVALATGDRVEAVGYVPVTVEPRDLFISVGFQTTSVVGELKRSLRRSVMPVTLVLLAAGLLVVLLPTPRRE
jgi:hypothetical protein